MKNNHIKISRILNSYGLDHYVSTHDGYGTTFKDIDKKLGASEKDKYRTRIIGVLNSIGEEVILFSPSTGDSIHTTLNGLSESLLEDNL